MPLISLAQGLSHAREHGYAHMVPPAGQEIKNGG